MAGSHPLIAIDLLYERRDLVPVSRAAETLNAAGEDALDRVLALTGGEGTPACSRGRARRSCSAQFARRYRRRLLEVPGRTRLRVTTDHHAAHREAIRRVLGRTVLHRRSEYLNNVTEQDDRAVKRRSYPMPGFGRFESEVRFCAALDELRQDFRVRRRGGVHVPLPDQRRLILARWHGLIAEMATA